MTSYPASPAAVPSANPSTVPSLQPTRPATTVPTPHPTPTLPAGTAAPPAPSGLTATARQEPCPDDGGFREFVQAAEVAGTGPGCVVVDLGWVPAPGADAVYRIYMTWSGEGARAACVPAEGHVIATSAPNAVAITVGPLENTTGVGSAASTWQPRTAWASPLASSSRRLRHSERRTSLSRCTEGRPPDARCASHPAEWQRAVGRRPAAPPAAGAGWWTAYSGLTTIFAYQPAASRSARGITGTGK